MMQSTRSRRKVASAYGDSGDKQDQPLLSSAIYNGEDLSPLVHKAFTFGKINSLLQLLRHFTRSKESEIEDVCKAHYQDFINAVNDL